MLEMSKLGSVEAEDILIIRDIVNYAFEKIKHKRTLMVYIFTFGFILPFYLQIAIGDLVP